MKNGTRSRLNFKRPTTPQWSRLGVSTRLPYMVTPTTHSTTSMTKIGKPRYVRGRKIPKPLTYRPSATVRTYLRGPLNYGVKVTTASEFVGALLHSDGRYRHDLTRLSRALS